MASRVAAAIQTARQVNNVGDTITELSALAGINEPFTLPEKNNRDPKLTAATQLAAIEVRLRLVIQALQAKERRAKAAKARKAKGGKGQGSPTNAAPGTALKPAQGTNSPVQGQKPVSGPPGAI